MHLGTWKVGCYGRRWEPPQTSHLGSKDCKLYVGEEDIRRRLHDATENLRVSWQQKPSVILGERAANRHMLRWRIQIPGRLVFGSDVTRWFQERIVSIGCAPPSVICGPA